VAPAIKYLPSKHKAFSLKPTTIVKEKLIKGSQGMVAQACDPHTWETEIGGLLVYGQPEPCNDTLSEKQQQNVTEEKRTAVIIAGVK
jgi:hypothetical protein